VALTVASLAFFALIAVYGARAHPMEIVDGAEQDEHVARVDRLLAGELPRDPLRPPLYPVLAAAVASVGIEPFAAARTVSNAASAALAAIAWGMARRLGGPVSGWIAFALLAAHPYAWTGGQEATTDPLFAAFGALSWLCALEWLARPDRRTAVACGAALGLAWLSRGSALLLLPGFLLLPIFAGRPVARERGRHRRDALVAALTCAAVALPLFALRWHHFGDPFHDENWRNLAFKLYGGGDWSYLERAPFESLLGVIAADPGRFVVAGGEELVVLFRSGGFMLFGQAAVAFLAVSGLALALARRRVAALWLAAAALAYGVALAFVFFAWHRFLGIYLPVALAFVALSLGEPGRELLVRIAPRLAGRWPRAAALTTAAAAVLVLVAFAGRTTREAIPRFVSAHPLAEARLLRDLAGSLPPGGVIAGTRSFFARQVPGARFVALPEPGSGELDRPELYLTRMRALFEREGVEWLVVGRVGLGRRPAALNGERPPVEWLRAERGDREARIWRVVGLRARLPVG